MTVSDAAGEDPGPGTGRPCENAVVLPGQIETERLVLRRQRGSDAPVFRQLWTERDPRVPVHRRIDASDRPSVEDIAADIRSSAATSQLLTVELKDTGEVIGYCGLVPSRDGSSKDELAFELLAASHGRGYATEASRAVLERVDGGGGTRLRATVWDWNIASRRVLARLGFRETGEVSAESPHGRSLVTALSLGHGRVEPWREQAEAVAEVLERLIPDLVGVYVHGSAALGGFGPASDLDVLVLVAGESATDWAAVGSALLAVGGERPLEMSVVDARQASAPSEPWEYLLHVSSAEQRAVVGDGGGDTDLVAHYAVTRAVGLPLVGPAPERVIGRIDRAVLLGHLAEELAWGSARADERYAVLNACRAVAYAEDGLLRSKIDGGRWWLTRYGESALVGAALAAQLDGRNRGSCGPFAKQFVAEAIERMSLAGTATRLR